MIEIERLNIFFRYKYDPTDQLLPLTPAIRDLSRFVRESIARFAEYEHEQGVILKGWDRLERHLASLDASKRD